MIFEEHRKQTSSREAKSATNERVGHGWTQVYHFEKTRYYAPEETSCYFRWADPLTTVTSYSPGPVERLLSPAVFAPSLTHRTYQPYNPLRSLLQRVFLRLPSTILPTRPHSLTTQSQYIHYTIHSFSFTDTRTIVPLSTPSPSTSTLLNSPHQPHWDPNTRDKSCFV